MSQLVETIKSRVIEIEEKIHIKKNAEYCYFEDDLQTLEQMLELNKMWLFELDESYKLFIQ